MIDQDGPQGTFLCTNTISQRGPTRSHEAHTHTHNTAPHSPTPQNNIKLQSSTPLPPPSPCLASHPIVLKADNQARNAHTTISQLYAPGGRYSSGELIAQTNLFVPQPSNQFPPTKQPYFCNAIQSTPVRPQGKIPVSTCCTCARDIDQLAFHSPQPTSGRNLLNPSI